MTNNMTKEMTQDVTGMTSTGKSLFSKGIKMVMMLAVVLLTGMASGVSVQANEFGLTKYQEQVVVHANSTEEAIGYFTTAIKMHINSITIEGENIDFSKIGEKYNEMQSRNIASYALYNLRGYGTMYSSRSTSATINLFYNTTTEQEQYLDGIVAAFVPTTAGMTDAQKVRAIHDYVCNSMNYDYATYQRLANRRTAFTGFAEGLTVCSGYATAFQRLADACGIQSMIVSGMIDGEGHAWNVVNLEGQWYHLDCTWADQSWGIYYGYYLIGANRMDYSALHLNIALAPYSYR